MGWMVSDLDLHSCDVFQKLDVVRFKSVSVLETFWWLEVISFLFVNSSHRMPTEHTLHLTLHQSNLRSFKGFVLLPQTKLKQSLHRNCFRMTRMCLQQLIRMFQSFLIIFSVMKFLRLRRYFTANCLKAWASFWGKVSPTLVNIITIDKVLERFIIYKLIKY